MLARELTHVIQQENASSSGPARITSPNDATEVEAAKVAEAVTQQVELNRVGEEDELQMARQEDEDLPQIARQVYQQVYQEELTQAARRVGASQAVLLIARAVYKTQPTFPDILGGSDVDGALKKAWTDSKPEAPSVPPGDPPSLKQEQGGWIVWNKESGAVRVIRVAAGTRDGLATIMGTRPAENGDKVVAWFHTHPNKAEEGYSSEPSGGDLGFTTGTAKVPGIIETHDGRKTIPYP